MLHIFKREFNSYLHSLIAYVVICVFLTGMGLLTWVFPETNVLDYGYADMNVLFSLGPYVMLFLIPAITMKMFAEERKAGTFEILATRPVSDWNIIQGKYFAALVLVIFALAPTLFYYFSIYLLGSPPGNIDTPGVIGSYIGFILLGASFTAIGLLSSSITENQVVAFVIAVFLSFIAFDGVASLAGLFPSGGTVVVMERLGMAYHYNSLSKGLVDLRDVIYFLSVSALFLMFTKLILGSRKW
jgi:ABC-2 type transport system permease protein